MDYPQEIASKMKKGLSNEIRKICEIGRVLRDVEGLSRTEVNYYMSIDEDFISDVLSCYKDVKRQKPESGKVYALTSASGPSIANGNTWEESVVPMTLAEARAISDDKEDAKRFDKKPFLGQKCRD